jgi:hypothetical protein
MASYYAKPPKPKISPIAVSSVPSSIGSWVRPYYEPSAPLPQNPGFSGAPLRAPVYGPAPVTAAGESQPQAPARPTVDLSNLNYSNDPILARVKALGQESIAHAEAEAKAARTRLVIGYGSPELVEKLKLSKDVRRQVEENPFSTLKELGRGYERRNIFDIDRPLSDTANLFYSTERGRQRALSGEQYLRDQAQAEAAVQENLANISNQIAQAKMAAQAQRIQAEQEAYQRALQRALYAAGV